MPPNELKDDERLEKRKIDERLSKTNVWVSDLSQFIPLHSALISPSFHLPCFEGEVGVEESEAKGCGSIERRPTRSRLYK